MALSATAPVSAGTLSLSVPPPPLPYSGPQSLRSSSLQVPIHERHAALEDAAANGLFAHIPSPQEDVLIREVASLKEENAFLKKYVERLNAELKYAQFKHPELIAPASGAAATTTLTGILPFDDPLSLSLPLESSPPWSVQSKNMLPLFVAYEARIAEVEEEKKKTVEELMATKERLQKLMEEHEKLENDYEANIVKLIQRIDGNSAELQLHGARAALPAFTGGTGGAALDYVKVTEELRLYKEQVDLLQEMDSQLKASVDRLRLENENLKISFQRQLDSERKAHQSALEKLKTDNHSLRQSFVELQAVKRENAHLSKSAAELQREAQHMKYELNAAQATAKTLLEKEKSYREEIDSSNREHSEIMKTIENVQKILFAYKDREVAQLRERNEMKEKMEHAMQEKRNAEQREELERKEKEKGLERIRSIVEEKEREKNDQLEAFAKKFKDSEEKLKQSLSALSLTCSQFELEKELAQRNEFTAKENEEKLRKLFFQRERDYSAEIQQLRQQLAERENDCKRIVEINEQIAHEKKKLAELVVKEKETFSQQRADLHSSHSELEKKLKSAAGSARVLEEKCIAKDEQLKELQAVSSESIRLLENELKLLNENKNAEVFLLRKKLDESYQLYEELNVKSTHFLSEQRALHERLKADSQEKLANGEKNVTFLHQRVAVLQHALTDAEEKFHSAEQQKLGVEKERRRLEEWRRAEEEEKEEERKERERREKQLRMLEGDVESLEEQKKFLERKCDELGLVVSRLQRELEMEKKKEVYWRGIQQIQGNAAAF